MIQIVETLPNPSNLQSQHPAFHKIFSPASGTNKAGYVLALTFGKKLGSFSELILWKTFPEAVITFISKR